MSEAKDAVAQAVNLQMRLAAACERRKEEAVAEIAKVRAELDALAGAPPSPEVEALVLALGAKIQALGAEAAQAEAEKSAALAEVGQLRKIAAGIPAAEARSLAAEARAIAGGGDEIEVDDVARALDGARSHIAGLDARVRLNDELSGVTGGEARPPIPTSGPMSEDDARAALAAMKAARAAKGRTLGEAPQASAGEDGPQAGETQGPTQRKL